MATYIQGLTDYIPQIQPFKPDFNFYAKTLQMKQDKYNAAKKQIGELYGSLLYGKLSRQSNIQRRDDFFKAIEQDLKKVSALDLSLQQNQDAAMKIFDPLINDDLIAHDYSATKHIQGQMERGESFRGCIDPKKCGGAFSTQSMTYLQMKLQDYANADDQTALSMNIKDINYVPYNNLINDAQDWAKAKGYLVENEGPEGGYIVKRQNGKIIRVPLLQTFMAVFGNDPKYTEQNKIRAYLNKKQWIQQNLDKYGDDEAQTEAAYYNDVMTKTIKQLRDDAAQMKKIREATKTKKNAVKDKISKQGVLQGDALIDDFLESEEDDAIADVADEYYKKVEDRITSLSVNKDNPTAFNSLMESIVADAYMKEDLTAAADAIANLYSGTTGYRENQFSLNAQQHSFRVREMQKQMELDVEEAKQIAEIEIGKQIALMFGESGLADENEGDPEGPGKGGSSNDADMFGETLGNYQDARNTAISGMKQYNTIFVNYLKSLADNKDAGGMADDARKELKAMLGPYYDEATNRFVKKGQFLDDYNQLDLNESNQLQIYKNGKDNVLPRNKNLFRNIAPKLQTISDAESQLGQYRDGYGDIIANNNQKIRVAAASISDVKDKVLFDGMFNDLGNGRSSIILRRENYVKKMMGTKFNKPMSPDDKKKFLEKKYDEYLALYKDIYNNQEKYVKGGMGLQDPYGNGLGNGVGGGQYANRRSWTSRYGAPNSHANRGFISYMKDVDRQTVGATKAIFGYDHTKDEYEDEKDSKTARSIFMQYRSDLMSSRYSTESSKEKAPSATITYGDVAANSGKLISVTLRNINPEWLKSMATDTDKKMIGDKSIADISSEGVTMYMSKEAAQNLFTRQHRQSAGDVYINAGRAYNISRSEGGEATIQRNGNNIYVTGYMKAYDGNGKEVRRPINNVFTAGKDGVSGEALINEYTAALNDQHERNTYHLEYGGTNGRMYTSDELQRSIQQNLSPKSQAITERIGLFRGLLSAE